MQQALIVWCVTDNKPGHRSQLEGLANALGRRFELELRWIERSKALRQRATPRGERPHLILCAGHRSHLPALALKLLYGGKLVVLMKPSLPRQLFNLCVVPEHDRVRAGVRVLETTGTVNDVSRSRVASAERGLILLGGDSRHHHWSDDAMLAQLRQLCSALPVKHWTLTTSPRTPRSFVERLAALESDTFDVVPYEQSDRGWLQARYRDCGVVWVSEDSASMVYEALSTGARVGVLPVPRKQASRVSAGLDTLLQRGQVSSVDRALQGTMTAPAMALAEADRVAGYLEKWLLAGLPVRVHESSAGIA